MRIYKPAYTKPLPPDAKIRRDKDGKYVIEKDRQGQPKKCRVRETAKGKRIVVESSTYTVVFRDHAGSQRRLLAFRDKSASETLGKCVGSLVYHRENGETLPAELQQWIDDLPDSVHKQLTEFGLVRRRRAVASHTLEEMLEHFEQHLVLKRQRSPRYVAETLSKLKTIFKECGFQTFADIDDIALDKYLLRLREKRNLSTRTLNGHLAHMQQFCRFGIRVLKVAKASPLECMEGFGSVAADTRRVRRALTANEVQRLLTTTAASTEIVQGMDGKERALVYKFALTTGLRANEIRTLRVEHVDFDHPEGPVLYIDAAYSKHRERDIVPLHKSLVPELKAFIVQASKTPGAKLFGGTFQALTDKPANMIRHDLEAAEIPYKTVAGVCDFHALRHTFVSSLKSVSARLAQGLARHKSSDMTDRYSHRSLAEQRAALESVNAFGLAG